MEENTDPIEIDGSHGEGGGQIIRNAVSYACLLHKKLKVTNIRAGRPNPGLASQHLESILAMLRITQATSSSRLEKGVTEFELDGTTVPRGTQDGVHTTIDLKTAGSTSLCIQCILPYLFMLKTPSSIRIYGGTHVMKAPNFDYLSRIFVPIMNRFLNYNIDIRMNRPGYFPRGGGILKLYVNREESAHPYNHFSLIKRGGLVETHAILNLTSKLANRTNEFCQIISGDTRNIEVRTVSYASVEYYLIFESSYVGFYYLAEGKNPSANDVFAGISHVQKGFQSFLSSAAAVDEFMQDQLIMYMALAKLYNPSGSSEIHTGPLTDHTQSAIHVSKLFLEDKYSFVVTPLDGGRTFSIKI